MCRRASVQPPSTSSGFPSTFSFAWFSTMCASLLLSYLFGTVSYQVYGFLVCQPETKLQHLLQ